MSHVTCRCHIFSTDLVLGVGVTSFFFKRGDSRQVFGEKWETIRNWRRVFGEKWETIWNSRRVIGEKWETIRYKMHHFLTKNEKNREKTGKTVEKNTKKTGEKTGKNRNKNRKLQEIQKRDFDKVLGNAENGNEFGNEFGNDFGNKFGNEFGNEFEVFSNVTKRRFEGKNNTSSHPYPVQPGPFYKQPCDSLIDSLMLFLQIFTTSLHPNHRS